MKHPETAQSIRVYDARSRASRRLLPFFFDFGKTVFSFAPDLGRGVIVNVTDGQRLAWIAGKGFAPIRLPVDEAMAPTWSPDGRWISFVGVQVAPTNERSYGVYLLSPTTRRVRALLTHLDGAGVADWSPDGRRLALPMQPPGQPDGLWLVDVASARKRLLLATPWIFGATWLPDGKTILAARGGILLPHQPPPKSGVYVVKVAT